MLNRSSQASQYKPAVMRAGEQDIPAIRHLLEVATQWLAARGMDNWKGLYTAERISQHFHDREIYIACLKNETVGTVTLNAADDKPSWYSNVPAIYVSAFAVSPSHHSHGIGSSLLLYVESIARQRGHEYVRLDAVEGFRWLTDFYKKRGYEVVGEAQRQFRYLQYEKKLIEAHNSDNKT